MKINQLRIGNYIQKNGLIASVEIINGEVDEIFYLGDDFYYSDNIDDLREIPLTEEWLLKFGFKKIIYDSEETGYGVGYDLEHKEFHLSYCDDFSISISYKKEDIGIVPDIELFRNVHQLQNLYYLLTGEELVK